MAVSQGLGDERVAILNADRTGGRTKDAMTKSIARLQQLHPDGDGAKVLQDVQQLRDETAAFERNTAALGRTCGDLDQLEGKAKGVSEFTATRYVDAASTRRREQFASLQKDADARISKAYNVADVDAPEAVLADIDPTKKIAADALCFSPSEAKELTARVNRWADQLQQAVAEEKTCRASTKCMGDRARARTAAAAAAITESICPIVQSRRESLDLIAQERRNPSGVVNLKSLHDWGEAVQLYDGQIAQLKAQYQAATKRAFNTASCPK